MYDYESVNEQLVFHFDELKSQRDGRTVNLIEHDLSIDELFVIVSSTLKLRSLQRSEFWKKSPLPLLVAATEVAYGYEGNGTEYWPLLDEQLCYTFSIFDRGVIRELFELFQKQFNGPLPPDTEWSRNFSIICWPIANAILPLDMRLPFSEAMAAANFDVAGQSNDRIKQRLSAIRVAYSSTRYRHWLATGGVAADLARYFLSAETPLSIFPATLRRIEKDMVADRNVRLALRNARLRQSVVSTKNGKKEVRKSDKKAFGKLQLREFDGRFRLEGIIPTFYGDTSGKEWLERNTRNRRWQPKPWGLDAAPVLSPSELLFGTPFNIPVRQLFKLPNLPEYFVSEEDSANLPQSVRKWSRSLAFNIDLPAVFSLSGEGLYQRTYSKTISPSKEQLVVFHPEQYSELPNGVVKIGSVGSLRVVRVNLESTSVSNWFENFGLRIGTSLTVTRIAPPSLGVTSDGLNAFLPDDIVGFSVAELIQDIESLTVAVERDGKIISQESITQTGIFLVDTSETGVYNLILSDSKSDLIDSWEFRIEKSDGLFDRDLCTIKVCTVSDTTVDLTSDAISIEVSCIRELTGLGIEIGLSTEDKVEVFRHQSLPTKIGVNHPIWKALVGDQTRRCISRGGDVGINVKVTDVAEQNWLLESDSPSIWWSFEDDELPKPEAENTNYDCHRIPLSSNSLILGSSQESDVQLLVPAENGEPKFELPCIVWCPRESSFPSEPHHPKRLPRRMEDIAGYFGIREWVRKYIALSCAKSPHAIAEINRDRFKQAYLGCINEVACGANWDVRKSQQEELLSQRSPLQVFLEIAKRNKAGFVSVESEIDFAPKLERELLAHVATVLPAHWWRFPAVIFTDSHGEQLDLAFQDAYFAVADNLASDQIELELELRQVSPFTDTACWQKIILESCDNLNGSHLSSLIVPLEGGDSLVRMPIDGLGVKELAQIIFDWRSEFLPKHRSSAKWTVDRLHTAFCLFLYPSYLRELDWETVIEALLTDRVTARAVSFLAWKKNHLERLDDM